jgi:hypothetical protein
MDGQGIEPLDSLAVGAFLPQVIADSNHASP